MNWTSAVLLQLSAILWTAASFSTYNFVLGGSGSRLSSGAQKSNTRCEHRSSCYCSAISSTLSSTEYDIKATSTSTKTDNTNTVSILPARQPLPQSNRSFSLLSWNILLPNSKDNWWCHKQYSSNTPMSARQWPHRHSLIKDRILQSNADIVCIQEADGETFDQDFQFMKIAGYDHVLHRKFRFRCATFYKRDQFTLENEAHKDRALVTALRSKCSGDVDKDTVQQETEDNILHIINCHLSGGAAPEQRLRQVHDALDQIRKWNNAIQLEHTKYKKQVKRQAKNIARTQRTMNEYEDCGIIVCGDFNSDGNTAVRKLLVDGHVDSDWYEPQYPTLQLTSKRKEQKLGTFIDAAELAWGGNVCDGDYSELHSLNKQLRPATYVVPNLASLLLKPVSQEQGPHRTQFGLQIAQGLATTLSLNEFCQSELDAAFDAVDEDKNGILDEHEVLTLLESAYVSTYGEQIVQERNNVSYLSVHIMCCSWDVQTSKLIFTLPHNMPVLSRIW
jgi:mRNA deadenylase 3'-5' endonuclease subunit Ccr4